MVSFILLAFIYYIKNMQVLEKCSLKYIHTYAQKVELNNLPSSNSIKQMYEENIPFIALSGDLNETDKVGILFTTFKDSPPIVEGRFFVASDFFSNHKRAVVGRNWVKKIYIVNGERFIMINNQEYSVIGIVGTDIETQLNDCIYYNLDSVSICDVLYIDGNNRAQMNYALSVLAEYGNVTFIDDPINGVNRLMGYDIGIRILSVMVIFIVVLFIFYSEKLRYICKSELYQTEFLFGRSIGCCSKKASMYAFITIGLSGVISYTMFQVSLRFLPRGIFELLRIEHVPNYITWGALLLFTIIPSMIYTYVKTKRRLQGAFN